jgi:succinoglycan biosynthesis transport protein ExoP
MRDSRYMTGAEQHPSDIREYIRVLRARKWEVAIVTIVLVGATLFFSFRQTPIYRAQARVLVRPVQNVTATGSVPQALNLDTEREVILSLPVATQVRQDLSLATPVEDLLENLSVQVVTDTEVLVVSYDDPSSVTAARLANGFATAYVRVRSQQTRLQFEAAATAVQQRIERLQRNLSSLRARIEAARTTAARETLLSRRDALNAQLGVLTQRVLDIRATESVVESGAAEVLQPAKVPASPVSPNKVRNGVLALFAGLALGVGFAFLRERLDDRVKSRHELERRLGAPVIAAVPRISWWKKPGDAQLIMRTDPKSPISEAYRTMGTNLQYMASQNPLKIIMVTSAIGGDGKTTTSANLAIVLAQAGKRVFLVSADLRKPRLHRFFGLQNTRGLSDLLSDSGSLVDVLVDPGVENLRIINAGPVPQDPAALLSGRSAVDFVEAARDAADFVVIDTPPVLAVADASIVAPLTDGTIFVLDAEQSSLATLLQARDQLENAGGRIIGAVYNNFDPNSMAKSPYYYYNYYYQYYGSEEESAKGNGSKTRRRRVRAQPASGGSGRTGKSASDL